MGNTRSVLSSILLLRGMGLSSSGIACGIGSSEVFFWEIDSTAAVASKPHKEIAAQARALNALSQFIMATADSSASQLASALFRRLEQHGYDRIHGGYREFARRDWGAMPDQRSYSGEIIVMLGPVKSGRVRSWRDDL